MTIHFLHAALFVLSILIIWTMSGILIEATESVAKRYNKPGFAVAFFVLGFLTSISEISVAINSTIKGAPQVSAGNLVGASIVIFLFIIPLLAILSGRIKLDHALRRSTLGFALLIVCVPGVLALDSTISTFDGFLMLCLYATLIYRIRKKEAVKKTVEKTINQVHAKLTKKKRGATALDGLYIVIGALLIFFGGKVLVEESLYFTSLLHVPPSVAGLLVLSLGTNVPEMIIALQSVMGKKNDIAFGDYVGSAVANVIIFAFLAIANGPFPIDAGEFRWSSAFMIPGFLLFFWFARSKNDISRKEGVWLIAFYVCFLVAQIVYLA